MTSLTSARRAPGQALADHLNRTTFDVGHTSFNLDGPGLLYFWLVRNLFMKHHADLPDVDFWQSHKERIATGYVHDVFPYEREKRFRGAA